MTIASKAYADALIDLALQMDVSVLGADRCDGVSRALSGRFTLRQALTRLLADAPCRFEIVDAKTVRIMAAPSPSLAARPAPSIPAAAPRRPASSPLPPRGMAMAEVVVTATKRGSVAGSTPAAISLISGARLLESGTRQTAGIAGQVAGVVVTNLGPGRDKILLRGLSDGAFTGRTRSTVGTYLDDVPITYNAPDPDLRLTDIERIEVVRGPQGALYGGGSLSGVFRIVTKAPDLDQGAVEIGVGAATTYAGAASGSWDLMANLPLAQGRAALRVVAYQASDGGYVDDVNLRLSDVDRTERNGGRLALALRPDSRWTLTANAAFQHLRSNDTQYTTMRRLQRANRVRETHKNNFAQGGLTIVRTGETSRLQSSTAYVRHDFSSLYDASAALSLFGSDGADLGVFGEAAKIDMLVQDIFVTARDPGRLDWLMGGYASRTLDSTPSMLRAAGGPSTVTVYSEQRKDRLTEGALYGELSYRLSERLTASIGGRIFETRLRTDSSVRGPRPVVGRDFQGSRTFNGVSPKISLQYRLGPGEIVYALASQGYRAGGFNTAGRTAPPATRNTYGSDRLENFEIGAKLSPFGGQVALRTAAFYDRWTDIQTDQFLVSGLSYTANVGDGRNVGLEGEVAFRPVPQLLIQANALLDSPRITHLNGNFATRVRRGLPGIPKLSFGAQAHYEQPLSDTTALLLGVQLAYVGRSYLTFQQGGMSSKMGDFVSARLSAHYRTPGWSLGAFLTNPANTDGDTFAYGNPFSFGQVRQVTPQRPRTAMLELSAAF